MNLLARSLAGLPPDSLPEGVAAAAAQRGAAVIDELLQLARPRYHVVGGQDMHWARPPYVNKDLGAGPRTTRFISLADVEGASECICFNVTFSYGAI